MFKLIRCNLINRKFHTAATLIMVALATAVLFSSVQIAVGMNRGLEVGMDRLGADILLLPKEIGSNVEQTLFTGVPMNIYMPSSVLEEAKQISGVKQASPQFFSQTLNESCCSLGTASRLVGIEQGTDFVLHSWLENNLGRTLTDNEIIIGGNIPSFLGDKAVILGKTFTVAGRLQPNGSSMDDTIFLPINVARTLALESVYLDGLWEKYQNPQQLISAVLIKVDNPQVVSQVAEKLNNLRDVNVVVASKVLQGTKQQLQMISYLLIGFSGIVWIICLTALLTRFTTLVMERKTEVGIFRALGARKTDIFKMVVLESTASSIAGGVVGLIVGSLFTGLAKGILIKYITLPFLNADLYTSLKLALSSLLVALLTGVLSSVYPAYRCAKIDPAGAIVQGELE